MGFLGKRGQQIAEESFVGLLLSILGVVVVTGVAGLVFHFLFPPVECANESGWKGVESSLSDVEAGIRKEIEVPFYNEGCPLVGFPSANNIERISSNEAKVVDGQAKICMCEVKQGKCKSAHCYSFTKFTKVRYPVENVQVSTENLGQYVFLSFRAEGADLVVSVKGKTREYQEFIYNLGEGSGEIDPGHLLSNLKIAYASPEKIEVQRVTVKRDIFHPKEMGVVKGVFPLFFDIVLKQGEKSVNSKLVQKMELEVLLMREEQESFAGKESFLFYQKDEGWVSEKLSCKNAHDDLLVSANTPRFLESVQKRREVLCDATIPEFAENFAIGVKSG